MIEMTVAVALIGTLIAVLVPVISRTQIVRTEGLVRERALSSVANLLDRAALLPQRTNETLAPLASELIAGLEITEPEWKFAVTPDGESSLEQLQATLSWRVNKSTRTSVSLVRWYPGGQP